MRTQRSSRLIPFAILILLLSCSGPEDDALSRLREGFLDPPVEARPRALWDWVDGNFQLEEITREMEEARRMGMGGFDIWDVRSVVDEDSIMPAGPAFMSDESVEAICHAINEAERLDLDLGLIVASGWNAGGSWTRPEHQTMGLFNSEMEATGPGKVNLQLPFPQLPDRVGKNGRDKVPIIPRDGDGMPVFYKEVAVIAYQEKDGCVRGDVLDLSHRMDEKGVLGWDVPAGNWRVVRHVCTTSGIPMISCTPNSCGPMIDHFNREAGEAHIRYFIEKLEEKLGKPIGESGLDYFYTDSYEMYGQLWTPMLAEEFQDRSGYSLVPYLPAIGGKVVGDHETTRRFLYDYRRVLSDLIIENHYTAIREVCEEHGVGFVAEAAGPGMPVHDCPFESLKSSGSLTFPRGEFWHIPEGGFWQRNMGSRKEHYLEDLQVIKGVASASHIYNQKYVEAEAFTGTHLWHEGPGDLKPTADRAFCEGLNRINFHTWPHTPVEAGTPGWVYAFGTLVNEHRIWWPMAKPWNDYLARCSYLLQQGNFVGDVLFYYGDSVPNFAPPKSVIPGLGFGYDYDYCNSDIILNRLMVEEGKLVLPHGQHYEILVLPDESYMQPEILQRIVELVEQGATVVGPKPSRSHGLHDWQERDSQVREMADRLWGDCNGTTVTQNAYGKGEVHWGKSLRPILQEKGVQPDLSFTGSAHGSTLDYIHRELGDTDIYFIRNTSEMHITGLARFRQVAKRAEYWDPATGEMFPVTRLDGGKGMSHLPLELDPYGSLFIVFDPCHEGVSPDRSGEMTGPESDLTASGDPGFGPFITGNLEEGMEIKGAWEVDFPVESAGAGRVVFDSLVSWNRSSVDGIRFFSGIATYEKEFTWDSGDEGSGQRYFLDLENVVETARVTLNGEELGILWTRPFRVEITECLRPGANRLEVEVANTWHNGLAGDARLPEDQRRTKSNVIRLPNAWSYPMESIPNDHYGLLEGGITGPVRILKVPG